MKAYSSESFSPLGARKKSFPLDITSAKKRAYVAPSEAQAFFSVTEPQSVRRGLDSVRSERRSFLLELQERSFSDTCIRIFRRGQLQARRGRRLFSRLFPAFSPHKMLYGSIVAGIAFGMVSMAFIEHMFGPGVFARSSESQVVTLPINQSLEDQPQDLSQVYNSDQDIFFEYFGQVTKEKYEDSIRDMVKGYPIESMLPYIFAQDHLTAAFLVGIAKKESNWGKRIPVLDGQDCFNYWGYRGVRRMMGSGGHTCFNSRKDAVETVAHRLETLIQSEKLNTPEKMIVWKCGFSCQGHSRESVKKWISDVDMYFSQLSKE